MLLHREWTNADATLNPPCSFPHRHCWMAIPKIAWPNLDVLQFSNTSTRNRRCVWPWSCESCAHFTHQLWNQMNWVQIMGRSCAEHFDMYKTQCIRSATTNRLHGSKFCNYKVQSTTWFEQNYIENNSRYALQKAMRLKLKKNWKSEMLTWNSQWHLGVYSIQSSDQHTFQKTFCSLCRFKNAVTCMNECLPREVRYGGTVRWYDSMVHASEGTVRWHGTVVR